MTHQQLTGVRQPAGGRAALEEFTELRWITVQEQPREYPI